MQRRMRERRDGDGAAGPPFTAAPTWAMDYVIHIHRITYLAKAKAKHVRNCGCSAELGAAAAGREAGGGSALSGSDFETAVDEMAAALKGSVRPMVCKHLYPFSPPAPGSARGGGALRTRLLALGTPPRGAVGGFSSPPGARGAREGSGRPDGAMGGTKAGAAGAKSCRCSSMACATTRAP